jgi:hypothetical protein
MASCRRRTLERKRKSLARTQMADMSENAIHYYAEQLPGNRGQLYRDVVIDGEIRPELSGPIGSPAPFDVVRRHKRTITLDTKTTEIGDLGDQMLLDSLTQEDAP